MLKFCIVHGEMWAVNKQGFYISHDIINGLCQSKKVLMTSNAEGLFGCIKYIVIHGQISSNYR